MSRIRIDEQERKAAILNALQKPRSRLELGRVVGWYRLNEFMADLCAERKIGYNRTEKVFELLELAEV
jgi:hypothetical protein